MFSVLSSNRFDMLSMSLVKLAKMLIPRSVLITSDMTTPSELSAEPLPLLKGGKEMFGMFISLCQLSAGLNDILRRESLGTLCFEKPVLIIALMKRKSR